VTKLDVAVKFTLFHIF